MEHVKLADWDKIQVGDKGFHGKTITETDLVLFAGISGDRNPVHLDEQYAEKSRFKKRIAHGLMSASYFSALFGTQLPGPGCVYVSQALQFKRPVYIGDTITATVIVLDIDLSKRMFKIVWQSIYNQDIIFCSDLINFARINSISFCCALAFRIKSFTTSLLLVYSSLST